MKSQIMKGFEETEKVGNPNFQQLTNPDTTGYKIIQEYGIVFF